MEPLPQVISWNLTRRCNLRCAHCYLDAAALASPAPGELSTAEALALIAEIAALTPGVMLILSGGEPLLRPDLAQLVRRAAIQGLLPVLGTNGTLLTPRRAVELKEAGLAGAGISIDSLVPERHDTFRGVPDSWNAAVRGLHAAQETGLEVQVQMTLTPANRDELDAAVRFCEQQGVRVLTVFFLVCTGRGQGLVDLAPEQYEEALGSIARLAAHGGPVMVRPRCAPTFRRVLAQADPDHPLLDSDAGRCMAGKSYCRITPEGDVTPCPYMALVAGNVTDRPFAAIWRESTVFAQLRDPHLAGTCGECEFRDICGGCRARALALRGDLMAEDPWCVHRPQPANVAPLAQSSQDVTIEWSAEAEERLRPIPFFVRPLVRRAVETLARQQGIRRVTPELMIEARAQMGRHPPGAATARPRGPAA